MALWMGHTSESLSHILREKSSQFSYRKTGEWPHGVMPYIVEGLYSERSTGRGSSPPCSISCRRRLEAPIFTIGNKI